MTSQVSSTVEIDFPALTGVWIHDPADPDVTIRNFQFANIGKTDEIGLSSSSFTLVGRTWPVTEFGDPQQNPVGVDIMVPFGNTWRDDVNALIAFSQRKTTLCYRDGRGRRVFGTLSGCKQTDSAAGTSFSLTVVRSDYAEAVL